MKIIFVNIFLIALFISCNTESENSNQEFVVNYQPQENGITDVNKFFYHNNAIEIDFVENKNAVGKEKFFTVQSIEQQKEDVIFRAKRIPKELYLINQGVGDSELQEALSDIANEQLFYFEFGESKKQDLMKKYFKADMEKPVAYLSFEILKDFYLVNAKGEKVNAEYVLYERTFHINPFEKILLGFNNISEGEELKLVYDDKLFGKGISEFFFAPENYIKNTIKQPA